jgi:hypothetical protein
VPLADPPPWLLLKTCQSAVSGVDDSSHPTANVVVDGSVLNDTLYHLIKQRSRLSVQAAVIHQKQLSIAIFITLYRNLPGLDFY